MTEPITIGSLVGNRLACYAILSSCLSPSISGNVLTAYVPTISSRSFVYRAENAGTSIRIPCGIIDDAVVNNFKPRTELGRKLLALRRAYLESGGKLLDKDALDKELQLRRGGITDV